MFLLKNKKKELNFLVSIGSGQNQLPLIHEAKKLGFHIIGIDINSTAPGFMECDLKIQESVENHEDIFQRLTELLLDGKIKGIMTKSYGKAIVTASHLNSFFKIPYLPVKSSESFLDKKKMKAIIANAGIKTAESIKIPAKTGKISSSFFPVIIKPETGHAKSGVELISTQAEYKKYLSRNSYEGNLIAEKFVKGDEIIAAGIIHNKKFYLIDITDKITSSLPFFVDISHISPSKHFGKWSEIENIGQKISDAFEIVNSPMIIEFIIDENNQLILIEAVPEYGGEFIPEIILKHSASYNIFSESIKSITSGSFKPPVNKKRKRFTVIKYITGEEGRLVSLNPESPKRMKHFLFSRIFKNIGDEIRKPENNHDRIGVVAVYGKTYDEALAMADAAIKNYDIQIRQK